jgi:hypothetical protein
MNGVDHWLPFAWSDAACAPAGRGRKSGSILAYPPAPVRWSGTGTHPAAAAAAPAVE